MSDKTQKTKVVTRQVIGCSSLLHLLTIAFVVLKLCAVIDWSWWWVVMPSIVAVVLPFAVVGIVLVGLVIFLAVCALIVGACEIYEQHRRKE